MISATIHFLMNHVWDLAELVATKRHEVGPLSLDNIHKLDESRFLIAAPGRMSSWQRSLMALRKLPATDFGFKLTAGVLGRIAPMLMSASKLTSELFIWDHDRHCLVESIRLPQGERHTHEHPAQKDVHILDYTKLST